MCLSVTGQARPTPTDGTLRCYAAGCLLTDSKFDRACPGILFSVLVKEIPDRFDTFLMQHPRRRAAGRESWVVYYPYSTTSMYSCWMRVGCLLPGNLKSRLLLRQSTTSLPPRIQHPRYHIRSLRTTVACQIELCMLITFV